MPGIDVFTFDSSSASADDGTHWGTISYRAWEMLKTALSTKPNAFPMLRNLDYYGAFDVTGSDNLERLIQETELIPGDDIEFRKIMGVIHGAAVTSWAAESTLSFLGEAR